MNNLQKYSAINPSEIDCSNVFFSVISLCKEKGIFDEKELVYVDATLNRMLEETAKYSGKGYIKREIAMIMLKNVFMILDSIYDVAEYEEIIAIVKEKRLYEHWQRAIKESARFFDRMVKNFAHLEHFSRKNPKLFPETIQALRDDCNMVNIFTYSLERARFTSDFFALGDSCDYRVLSEGSEILSTELDLMDGLSVEILEKALTEKTIQNDGRSIPRNAVLFDSLLLSLLYGAFYRSNELFPHYEAEFDVEAELKDSETSELCETFYSYISIYVARNKVKTTTYSDTVGENILNLYASRACPENFKLLAHHLAVFVKNYIRENHDIPIFFL